MTTIPSLFISHGSPMLALEDEPTAKFLRQLSSQLPKPEAIVIASAHFETDEPTVTGAMQPETIHDFYGFPQQLYELRYPARGDSTLAARIQALLANAGIEAHIDPVRGLDHGAWSPLLLMYSKADIPVIEISVQPGRNARWHYQIGQALAGLRDEGIMIIGTGNLTHNLREAFKGQHAIVPEWVTTFAQWIAEQVAHDNVDNLLNWQTLAPYARENHPTTEHFMPFFVALGAGGLPSHAKHLHQGTALGVLAMDAYAFGGSTEEN